MAISTIQNASLASGVPSASKLPAGSVVQVVNGLTQSSFTSSGSQVTVIEASITPSSSSNKILVMYTSGMTDNNNNGQDGFVQIRRGGSSGTILGVEGSGTTQYFWGLYRIQWPTSMQIIDSPSATTSTTYGVYIKNSTGTCSMYGCSFVLMEIAG